MKGMWAIYRREMGHYFVSPIAYIVVGVFLVLSGFFFNGILTFFIERSFEQMMEAARFGGPAQMDVPGLVSRNFFAVLGSLVLFVVPMLTMGVYAEEKKRGTMELLMTSPLSDAQIVLGKFLGSLTLFCIMLLPTALYQVALFLASDPRPPLRMILAGYLGVLLLGSLLLAIGSFISSLTENQIIAAVLTFGVFLILWVIDLGAGRASVTTSSVLEYISIVRHYDDFTRGVIDTTNLVFYVTLAGLGLFLTLRAMDATRWRRA